MKILIAFLIAILLDAVPAVADDASESAKLFALKLKPLFAEKCLACHGNDSSDIKGGFDMRSRASMLLGGDSFTSEVLIEGQGEDSYVYRTTTRSIEDFEMPPKEADQLSAEQQRWIREWIDAGAPWPDDEQVRLIEAAYAEGEQVTTSQALSEDWQNRRYEPQKLWAYRPLQVAVVPEEVHPIDWFIDQRLNIAGLAPAPPAAAARLARRMSFGLTGLPASPEETRRFQAAFERDRQRAVVDFASQLMASPHYGEHFGLRWLDVVRYADSAGFANDYSRPNAWRYRDYVVRAFNSDKPYDQFVLEQIAGDELEADAENVVAERMIATGFLRMGPWEQTGMSVFKETRQQWLDDVTDSVGQTFLGHALQCAKCHDHKFDPVPTRDYYSIMAVFSTTQFAERDASFLETENRHDFSASDEWVAAKIAAYQQQKSKLQERVDEARKAEKAEAKIGDNGLAPGDEASLARMSKNISRHQWELERTQPIAFSVYTGSTIQRKNVDRRIPLPNAPWGEGVVEVDAILTGGSAYAPSEPVSPGALSAVEALSGYVQADFPDGRGKRRLALAQWISNARNPLTARVMANRIWSWHFGVGLAGNPNNFGGTGVLPSHPELLDFLADYFVKNDWSVKKLNELIVSSEVYQRDSIHPTPEHEIAIDPEHKLYAVFPTRRLLAEELRDAMLASSGELNRQVGGIPAHPDLNLEVAFQPRQIMGGTASVYEPDPLPQQRNRRSLYVEKIRGLRDPFLESFNQPGPDKSCELRETSTVAPQALMLFNSEDVHDRALALAVRLANEELDERSMVSRAFELVLGRPASHVEQDRCLGHWHKATVEEQSKSYTQRTYPSKLTRTAMAEKTGEPYSFEEVMPAFANYQPDVQPADVDAKTRGLAQLCLVLFNLNEFVYLD
jgi:mono/diheme cytochrome c family protein